MAETFPRLSELNSLLHGLLSKTKWPPTDRRPWKKMAKHSPLPQLPLVGSNYSSISHL